MVGCHAARTSGHYSVPNAGYVIAGTANLVDGHIKQLLSVWKPAKNQETEEKTGKLEDGQYIRRGGGGLYSSGV